MDGILSRLHLLWKYLDKNRLAAGRAAWSQSVPVQPSDRFQVSWALSGWLAIAAIMLFLLNLGVDSFNRNAFHARFVADTSKGAMLHVAAVNAFTDAFRRQKQFLRDSGLFYR